MALFPQSQSQRLVSFSFEVFGTVQGVFFRKYTKRAANRLGLVGWCQNTSSGTVAGVVQGKEAACREMRNWLQNEGSPRSHIENLEVKDWHSISSPTFLEYVIRR
eukprot:TRINITY_DN34125_c0_g1_i1.p2 TRINITY_DN34125_c0_g1~~TRINITY_DN34125_c0_g1_i1.p2  ORF type:complete len:105 (+),score=8.48 TRINITY_DN34125_c0_g1_i1:156-470(+)